MYYLLFYTYVENIFERRKPFRQSHLKLASDYVEKGMLLLGGAYADPADGACLVFKTDSPEAVEEFVKQDPYVKNQLVTRWQIRPWTVVVGSLSG